MRPRCSVAGRGPRLVAALVALAGGACDSSPGMSSGAVPGGPAPASASPVSASPAAAPAVAGRSREMLNPDDASVVLLYFDLAGIAPRINDWVEQDPAVQYAPAADKAGRRATRRAELEAAAADVREVGALRLTLDANLSPYDPAYGEFTVRALAPSSVIRYSAFGQNVEVNFSNGLTAQTWKVPAGEAQAIQDRVSGYRPVSLDVLLRVTGVRPGPGGGKLLTEVVEYELREQQSGAPLARVRVGGSSS